MLPFRKLSYYLEKHYFYSERALLVETPINLPQDHLDISHVLR